MNTTFKPLLMLSSTLLILSACSTSKTEDSLNDDLKSLQKQVKQQETSLEKKEKEIESLNRKLASDDSTAAPNQSFAGDLLPPNAKKGECYARVWVAPKYKTITEDYIAQEAGQKISIEPAQFEMVEEKVLVKEASEELVPVEAKYSFQDNKVKVSDAVRTWRIQPWPAAAVASKGLVDTAKAYGVDVDGAKNGECFHEHYTPAKYESYSEDVLVKEASENVTTNAPVYETVQEKVLVKEASEEVITVPAVYETAEKKIIDIPAHTVWKKGTGPIQKIDESTGEIMCLVDVPATYKTIKSQVIKTPATTKTVKIPAEYKMIEVRKLVSAGTENRTDVPAVYSKVNKKKITKEGKFVWHHVSDKTMTKHTRTHSQICMVETPAQFKTVKQRVTVQEAGFEKKEIPAQYAMVKVRKVTKPAKEIREEIPEVTKTLTRQELTKEGEMEWRSILCETNMTNSRITDIQTALKNKGFNPGPIDGVIGTQTIKAMNKFQEANQLPIDKYINLETLKALGVSSS